MATSLDTFAKVRALHDRTDNPGEKVAAMARMQALASKAGMTVEQAVSKLDSLQPKARPQSMVDAFAELFNSPEMKAARAERERKSAERRAAALAEYGTEDAVWAKHEREEALETACKPVIVRKPIINGEMDTLQGYDGGSWTRVSADAQTAVMTAYAPPANVREAWAEYLFWDKQYDDRLAFCEYYDHDVRVRARIAWIEHQLDALPARSMSDLRARLDWAQHINERDWNRGNPEDAILLATLRSDIERMGARLHKQNLEASA